MRPSSSPPCVLVSTLFAHLLRLTLAMRRSVGANGADEESPLVKNGVANPGFRRNSAEPRTWTWVTRALVLGAVIGCVGVATYASGLGGHYWPIAPGGRVLGPAIDTCSSKCTEVNETSTHTYAYSDPRCATGGFGCQGTCRLCHIKPYPGRSWRYQQCPTCVCNAHKKSTGCDPCASSYSYFRFNVKTIRENDPSDPYYGDTAGCGTGVTQFSEIKLYSNGGATLMSLNPSQSAVLSGTLCATSEGPNAATDGSLNTKMCDQGTILTSGGLNFVFAATTPSTFSHYEFFTANDCPVRDPTSWTLYGSTVSNQGPWIELGSGSDRPPVARKTTYGKTQVCF